jgi:hypothetical protein
VPVRPVDAGNGTITAGPLTIATAGGSSVALVDMTKQSSDFTEGWRVDITAPAKACAFDVTLTAG